MNLITGDLAIVIEKTKRNKKTALGLENPIGSYSEKKNHEIVTQEISFIHAMAKDLLLSVNIFHLFLCFLLSLICWSSYQCYILLWDHWKVQNLCTVQAYHT